MPGTVVRATHEDSIRIQDKGSGALTIPAFAVLALDKVLRHCLGVGVTLRLDVVEESATRQKGWQAVLATGERSKWAYTPWGALVNLADEIAGEQS